MNCLMMRTKSWKSMLPEVFESTSFISLSSLGLRPSFNLGNIPRIKLPSSAKLMLPLRSSSYFSNMARICLSSSLVLPPFSLMLAWFFFMAWIPAWTKSPKVTPLSAAPSLAPALALASNAFFSSTAMLLCWDCLSSHTDAHELMACSRPMEPEREWSCTWYAFCMQRTMSSHSMRISFFSSPMSMLPDPSTSTFRLSAATRS
mmetsp:Transcript_37162/g.112363  ORF Transcript_37162/g.112363 Transcript_37162/m.112363 type:complete len:203 (+) Transcript_37162:460-1068(+)